MRSEMIDEVLLSLRDRGLSDTDQASVDVLCRARIQAELENEHRQGRTRRSLRPGSAVRLATALGAVLAIAGGTYAVPVTRAAFDDVYSSVADWVSGDAGSAPGRPLSATDDVPSWVTQEGGQKRVVAETGGVKLYAIHDGDRVSVALGSSVGLSSTVAEWRRQFAGHKIVVLGPGEFPDARGIRQKPLFGLASKSVSRVELSYASGSPVTQEGLNGGFALTVDVGRPLRFLTAYDSAGEILERVDLGSWHLLPCPDIHGCVPAQ